jgi:hypothetical protein
MTGTQAEVRTRARFTSAVLVLMSLSLPIWPGCRRKATGPQPPDLKACTRLEVHDPYGTLNYVISDAATHADIFSDEEKKFLRSFATHVIANPDVVRAFAWVVSRGTYVRRSTTSVSTAGVNIICYHGDERVASLQIYSAHIKTSDGSVFKYADGLLGLSSLRPAETEPLRLRFDCAGHQSTLATASLLFRRTLIAYPDPNRWCDITADTLWRLHGGQGSRGVDLATARLFQCPAAQERAGYPPNRTKSSRLSHYAMNPDCRPDSPGDVVLFFETKAGWNQHGGPELFTFDNHDPKGGCVLLNDGTSRFIRTKEELAQLRWKP